MLRTRWTIGDGNPRGFSVLQSIHGVDINAVAVRDAHLPEVTRRVGP
jgi:hypothetical protein